MPRFCDPAPETQLIAHRQERTTVSVRTSTEHCKVLKIGWSKRDGSLFVHLPYFKHRHGLLARPVLKAGGGPQQVSLERTGKTVSHRVKFTYHADGEVHFSQDGKILTVIRKRSTPIREASGHVFTLMCHGLSDFEPVRSAGKPASGFLLALSLPGSIPEAVKIVGSFFVRAQLRQAVPELTPSSHGPAVRLLWPNGEIHQVHLLENPHVVSPTSVLALYCEPLAAFSPDSDSTMVFYGGFDPANVALDPEEETVMLALIYPAAGFEFLQARVGSIDYSPNLRGEEA
ncbi:MAG: hypothetical protein Q8N47_00935 [Bryobacterales bacterium]|nr:hypothetical protein [Bryobacterales bacterium]